MNGMQLFYDLYMEVNVFGALIMLVLLLRLGRYQGMRGQRNFMRLLLWQAVMFLSDGLSRIMQDFRPDFMDGLVWLFKSLYFVSTVAACYECFIYFEYCRDTRAIHGKRTAGWLRGPLLCYILLILVNFRGRFLFYVDEQGIYHRGNVFFISYALYFLYVTVSTSRSLRDAFRKENYADRGCFFRLGILPILPIGVGIFQYYVPTVPLLCPVLCIISIWIFSEAMEQMIFADPLTGVNNRRYFMHRLVGMMKELHSNERLYFAMIDLNNFKSINDHYGHAAGDQALTVMAEAMRRCAEPFRPRIVFCRCGGDEFAAALRSEDGTKLRRYLDDVAERTGILTENRKLPWRLTFSAGIQGWNGTDDPGRLIADADREMYRVKAQSGMGR